MVRIKDKKFISIRSRLFLQVGAITLVAITLILITNNSMLPYIYTQNEKRQMRQVAEEINKLTYTDNDYYDTISRYEKNNSFSIDIYLEDGTPLYYGTDSIIETGGKVTVSKRENNSDGSFFEIQNIEKENIQFIVYAAKLSTGGEIEMYSKKSTVDDNANVAILLTSLTSVFALLAALVVIYIYTGKFAKPLIAMSNITGRMADMDFSSRCEVKGNDEISMLSESINYMSESLCTALEDLNVKNKKLEQDIEKEKTLDKIRKDFISNVSHELKTPISIIRGYSEGAELMLDSGDTQGAKNYCNIIVSETDKMNVLVLQLLELSSYESGSVGIKSEKFGVRDMFEDYADDNRIKFEEKNIVFEDKIPQDFIGSGDIIKLQMIVNNYISNAVSHIGGENKISATAEETDNKFRVSVFNTGEPIADEDIDKIWIAFYRADKAHSRSEGRFGLGLSIVSAIQKLHGCEYGVYNTDDGVCFWFDINKG